MKKFISMVMAAAMVVSLVPATAFAASVGSTTAKVVDKHEVTVNDAGDTIDDPELQLVIGNVDQKETDPTESITFTLAFENAKVAANSFTGKVTRPSSNNEAVGTVTVVAAADDEEIEVTIKENGTANFRNGDVISVALKDMVFTKTKLGTEATVKAKGDIKSDEVVFAAIVEKGIKAELDEDCVDVAPEEVAEAEAIVIEPNVGTDFASVLDTTKPIELKLKLNKGFEFANNTTANKFTVTGPTAYGSYDSNAAWTVIDGDTIVWTFSANELTAETKLTITGLDIEATTAKAGDVAAVTVKMGKLSSVKVADVAKVVDYKVVMELVDADEDVPVFYNGVDSNNTGLTVDDDHKALEVNISETFQGAWSNHKEFTLSLPEGVHVVDMDVTDGQMKNVADVEDLFKAAYQKGDHEEFVFAKRVFEETLPADTDLNEMQFVLVLTADPDFVGDVTLKLEGAAVDTQEVVIAKFVAPYTIEAKQNDVIIDYRHTAVPTEIVITEAEAGLWAKGLEVSFQVEKDFYIEFEDDATVTVNEASEMEIDDEVGYNGLGFEVTATSDEEAAVITISDIELFMQRNIPAGAYALEVAYNSAAVAFEKEGLFAPDVHAGAWVDTHADACDEECYVEDVADYSSTVHEAFINVITAGRDQDDASFTTKVVVPVGESYIIAGESQVALDVPAYINADGYTMLPVRAVATALGIHNNNVIWSQAAKQVTILYGQRIITMTVGQSVVYVNGSAIPASAAVEVVDGRAFLGLRDLANALGVTEIAYDAATKTATLN